MMIDFWRADHRDGRCLTSIVLLRYVSVRNSHARAHKHTRTHTPADTRKRLDPEGQGGREQFWSQIVYGKPILLNAGGKKSTETIRVFVRIRRPTGRYYNTDTIPVYVRDHRQHSTTAAATRVQVGSSSLGDGGGGGGSSDGGGGGGDGCSGGGGGGGGGGQSCYVIVIICGGGVFYRRPRFALLSVWWIFSKCFILCALPYPLPIRTPDDSLDAHDSDHHQPSSSSSETRASRSNTF